MKCEKCGKNIPDMLDYCPTCKISQMNNKENRNNIPKVIRQTKEDNSSIKFVFLTSLHYMFIVLGILSIILYLLSFIGFLEGIAKAGTAVTDFVTGNYASDRKWLNLNQLSGTFFIVATVLVILVMTYFIILNQISKSSKAKEDVIPKD